MSRALVLGLLLVISGGPVQIAGVRLQPGSPAIDAGICLPEVTHDIEGVPRPQGTGCDIGASEYLPPPQAPTGLQVRRLVQ